ncbi:MAG TPA: ABC transporter substrate-binding protein [Gaiellaceae bacterium]|jgi:polar amino acid transport system substrate-binding protein|nr:ABC transporter substrate-binding protein [Gaiellaceae bacterium]
MRLRISALAAVTAIGAVALGAGCGSSNDDNGSSGTGTTAAGAALTATPGINVAKDDAIASAAANAVNQSGQLSVATDATYPPMEFFAADNSTTVIGADADIAKALGQIMGLTPKVQNTPFDSILPGLTAGKYDLGISSFTDTKERQATNDFVTYAQAGTSFYSSASSGVAPKTLADLCGHSVAMEKGTTQQADAEDQAKQCQVDVQVYPDQNGANLAISSGRAELGMADSPVAAYIVEQSNGQFKLGDAYGVAPYGIAMKKGSALAQPLLDAVKALYADGTMQKIFDYWQLKDSAISSPQINGAIS